MCLPLRFSLSTYVLASFSLAYIDMTQHTSHILRYPLLVSSPIPWFTYVMVFWEDLNFWAGTSLTAAPSDAREGHG